MNFVRGFFGSSPAAFSPQAPLQLSRGAVFAVASYKLFGVTGLDPAGNIILRFAEGRPGFGGWFRAQHLDGTHTFPLHWAVGERLVHLSPQAAIARAQEAAADHQREQAAAIAQQQQQQQQKVATEEGDAGASADAAGASQPAAPPKASPLPPPTANPILDQFGAAATGASVRPPYFVDPVSNVLRIDPRISLYGPNLKLLRVIAFATYSYKAFYFVFCAGILFVALCGYLRFKTKVCGVRTRARLNAIEDGLVSIRDAMWPRALTSVEDELKDLGVSGAILNTLRDASNHVHGRLKGVATELGYDESVYDTDQHHFQRVHQEVQRGRQWDQRRTRYWSISAWVMTILVAILALML